MIRESNVEKILGINQLFPVTFTNRLHQNSLLRIMVRKKIFAISGSTREGSVNELILKGIKSTYADVLDVSIFEELYKLPHFNPDIGDDLVAGAVKNFRRQIEEADGVIICTPEYVFSLPGALKNALEWTVSTTIFSNKPVALIVAASLGEKTFESLNLIMSTLGARIGNQSTLLIQGARAKFNPYQTVVDEQTKRHKDRLIQALIEAMEKPKA